MRPSRSAIFYLALAAGPGLLVLGLVARFLPTGLQPACLSHLLTGMPCPGCGSYRALSLFAAGRWSDAFVMQPLMTLLFTTAMIASLSALLAWLFKVRLPAPPTLSTRTHLGLIGLSAFAMLANWIYLIIAKR